MSRPKWVTPHEWHAAESAALAEEIRQQWRVMHFWRKRVATYIPKPRAAYVDTLDGRIDAALRAQLKLELLLKVRRLARMAVTSRVLLEPPIDPREP